ncbi:MAG: hypothetical protein ACREIV_09055, partial [Planctomycetaceae bacterium]
MRRVLGSLLVALSVIVPATATEAGRDPLPADAAVVIEVHQPLRLADHPLVQNAWNELKQSGETQRRLESPEFDRVRQAAKALEEAAGTDRRTAVEQLTAGGLVVAVRPGPPPRVTAVVTAADADLLRRLTDYGITQIKTRLEAQDRADRFSTQSYRGHDCHQVGQACFTVIDRRLLLASDIEGLKDTIDRLLDGGAQRVAETAADTPPLLRFDVDLAAVRKLPQLQKPLAWPSQNAGLTALLGGWVDLLRHGERLIGEVTLNEDAINSRFHVATATDTPTPGLAGYFATAETERAAPLLQPPGTIFSASWHRDYAALWNRRSELLTSEEIEKLEQGDAEL